MSSGRSKLSYGLAICFVCGALLLAGCGGRGSSETPTGGSSDAAEQPTRAALPTMPSARFAAPTTMITPQSSEQSSEDEVEATATLTATQETTATEEMTATEDVTATEEMTDTE